MPFIDKKIYEDYLETVDIIPEEYKGNLLCMSVRCILADLRKSEEAREALRVHLGKTRAELTKQQQ